MRLDFIGLDLCRQTEGSLEGAIGSFREISRFVLLFLLRMLFALDGQHVVVKGDVHILFLHAGQLDRDFERIVARASLDRRRKEVLNPIAKGTEWFENICPPIRVARHWYLVSHLTPLHQFESVERTGKKIRRSCARDPSLQSNFTQRAM